MICSIFITWINDLSLMVTSLSIPHAVWNVLRKINGFIWGYLRTVLRRSLKPEVLVRDRKAVCSAAGVNKSHARSGGIHGRCIPVAFLTARKRGSFSLWYRGYIWQEMYL